MRIKSQLTITVRTSRPNAPEDISEDVDSARRPGSLDSFSTGAGCIFGVNGNRPALKLCRQIDYRYTDNTKILRALKS